MTGVMDAAERHKACEALNDHRSPGDPFFGELPLAAQKALVDLARRNENQAAEIKRLDTLINAPTTDNWFEGVRLEAAHQQEKWGSSHDAGKSPLDWFWLIGYLAQKAAQSAVFGDIEKAKHHTISTAAALLNWHRALTGENTSMRPGTQGLAQIDRALNG